MSLKAFLLQSHTPPKQNHIELEEIPVSQSIGEVESIAACSSLPHLACAKYSHFLGISTETGYLFLLTAPTLNNVTSSSPCFLPMPQPTSSSYSLGTSGSVRPKQVPTNKHLTSPSLCLFLCFVFTNVKPVTRAN